MARTVDAQGELDFSPPGLRYVWPILFLGVLLEAANELFGFGGTAAVYRGWIQDLLIAAAAVLVLARAAYEPTNRSAWLAFGLAMAFWSSGSIAWSIAYGGHTSVPFPTFADVLWLLWYPLMAVGIIQLIRVHLPNFELHRWMDGLAVTLLIIVAGFAVVIQPTIDEATQGTLATIVDFSYPILDVLLIGAILGVYGLLGWHPDRMWVFIGLGTLAATAADAAFAVQEARGVGTDERYAFVWTLGALFLAYAAWTPASRASKEGRPITGMRAIALPLAANALAAGIQVYAIFRPVGKSERIVTLAVLVVSSIQIVLTRPRSAGNRESAPSESQPAEPTKGSTWSPDGQL
jgi:uncharacterized membrane protein (DUF106 family)